MDKENQIEEIAKLICGLNTSDGCFCDGGYCNYNCLSYEKAESIYNAGYRKQIEGEWVDVKQYQYRASGMCSVCKTTGMLRVSLDDCGIWYINSPYCPNCGAKMRKECNGK